MDQGTVGRIEDWDARPFTGGYDGLRDLAGADFSGAVSADGVWVFMLNGRIVGVARGSLDDVQNADGTAYEAPHPSLPLLFAMRQRGGETRAKYYTDDTPLEEVDRTLSEGGFTGYVELSENVLSGDYYVVYYGGESLSAAFIGNERRLVTGDEAFEQASDEVGIYEVRTVDLDVEEVPEPRSQSAAPETAAGTASAGETRPTEESEDADDSQADDAEATTATNPSAAAESQPDPAPDRSAESRASEPDSDSSVEQSAGDADSSATGADADRPAEIGDAGAPRAEPEGEQPTDAAETDTRSGEPDESTAAAGTETARAPDEDPFSEEEEWREARTIPSLDPEETEVAPPDDPSDDSRTEARTDETEAEGEPTAERTLDERVRELRAAIESYENRVADLERQLEETTTERDELREERDRLEEERDRLQRRIRELESGSDGDDSAAAGQSLTPDEALDRTDLFVRYGSKGEATLETAHAGGAERDSVNENLRLETHTRFEDDEAAVDGEPFEAFLNGTLEYEFVRWVIEDLLYEIRDTSNDGGLREIYDAIPRVDRVEFHGSITARDEEGEELRNDFDVILRDRMGSPLIVADLNDARDPATSEMLEDLLERATSVAEDQESLGGAFLVTASFFEPAALGSADEATDGGLLNRDARKSFVKLSRKRGYHLCLAEARGDEFHVAVPEL